MSDVQRATETLAATLAAEPNMVPTMGLAVACAARQEMNLGTEQTELHLFQQAFPRIGLTGMLGGGEIGFFDEDLQPPYGRCGRHATAEK